MLTLYYCDHLPSKNNELGIVSGWSDQGVSDWGKGLARYLAFPEGADPDDTIVVCSSQQRCIESAELCFGHLDLPVIADPRLNPVNYGTHHGRPMEEIYSNTHSFLETPYPDGESFTDMAARYRSFFADLKVERSASAVIFLRHHASMAIVTHLKTGVALSEAIPQYRSLKRKSLEEIEAGIAKGFIVDTF